MAVNRTSASLIQFLGAQISAEVTRAQLSNVVRGGTGNERPPSASVFRLVSDDLELASINPEQYDRVLGTLLSRGLPPNTAPAMAALFIDVANRLRVPPLSIVEGLDQQSRLTQGLVYQYMNQLRSDSSQIGAVIQVTNDPSRYFTSLYPDGVGPPEPLP